MGDFKFEAFINEGTVTFSEYLSTIIAKLPKSDKKYRTIQEKMTSICGQYPKVMDIFDSDQAAALTEEECAALIKVLGWQAQLVEIEIESIYFRGCYDGVGFLRKAGIL